MVYRVVGYLFSGVVVGIDKATAFSGKQALINKWQKNNTLAGLLIFGVAKMAISLGKSTILQSHFFYSQNQCKDFRFHY